MRVALAARRTCCPTPTAWSVTGIEGGSALAALMRAGRFEELDRYDGQFRRPGNESGYAAYLRAQGYNSDDPWSDDVIAADGPDGEKLSGWHMRNVRLAGAGRRGAFRNRLHDARGHALRRGHGETPRFLHLPYVKPHWPNMAPAPYHALYAAKDCLPLNRDERELVDQHPVLAADRQHAQVHLFSALRRA